MVALSVVVDVGSRLIPIGAEMYQQGIQYFVNLRTQISKTRLLTLRKSLNVY